MAKLLIVGASRGIGLETVKAALRTGHSVRALARSAANIPIEGAGLEMLLATHLTARRSEMHLRA
jgi:NAD(P)-dependent dehydrogenase (short-subunit alcohol dehydrogenase family)